MASRGEPPARNGGSAREARLAEELRANLLKRKALAREKASRQDRDAKSAGHSEEATPATARKETEETG